MVRIRRPDEPPVRPPTDPIYHALRAGTALRRIFDPAYQPALSDDRAVFYTARTLSGCVVEVCGDDGMIVPGTRQVAHLQLRAAVRLLDLRAAGAMRVGSVAALAKVADRAISQAWARYLYEHPAVASDCSGFLYANAHNDEDALVLFERAESSLALHPENPTPILRLDSPSLRPYLQRIARENNLAMF
jgi:hypothetical protein